MFYRYLGPNQKISVQASWLVKAWFNYSKAVQEKGEGSVMSKDWQWKAPSKGRSVSTLEGEEKELHHRCNQGHRGCSSHNHLLLCSQHFNLLHKGCSLFLICPGCKVKIRNCPEEDPLLCCMNNKYVHCSKCRPDNYPAEEMLEAPDTPCALLPSAASPLGSPRRHR